MPTPPCEWPLPSMQSLGREGWGCVPTSCIPWSPFGPQKGRAGAAALAATREPGLGQHPCPAPRGLVLPLSPSQGARLCRGPGAGGQRGLMLVLLSFCSSRALKQLWLGKLLG